MFSIMKNKKIPIIFIIILGLILIGVGVFFLKDSKITKPNTKTESQKVEAALKLLIDDLLTKDASPEAFNTKYNVDYFSDAYLPFAEKTIVTYKAKISSPDTEQQACLAFVDVNYNDLIKAYKKALDYKVSIDETKKEASLTIKVYQLRHYHNVLTKVSDLIMADIEDKSALGEEVFFANRCLALKAMNKNTDEFNKGENLNVKVNYKFDGDKFILEDYSLLGNALSGMTYIMQLGGNDEIEAVMKPLAEKIYKDVQKN